MELPFRFQFYRTSNEAWIGMLSAIRGATRSIYWEVYIFVDDAIGNKFIDVLVDKAQQGVDVKLVIDAVGSYSLSSLATERLKAAGVDVRWYNHLSPEMRLHRWLWRLNQRNHRKLLIVDEETAFVGGVNVRQEFAEWNDLYIRITGRTVWLFLHGFAKSYVRAGGSSRKVRHLLRPKLFYGLQQWMEQFHVILHNPGTRQKLKFRQWFMHAIAVAKQSITLLTPYYVPDREFLELIRRASLRGVEVDIMFPWRPDHKIMQQVSRAYIELSHRAGATIHFLKQMNHGKALLVDKKLGLVGSGNFTPRTFWLQTEVALGFRDQGMIDNLDEILQQWKVESVPFDSARWKGRGIKRKLTEWAASFLSPFV